jgi:predicted transcriptional regulator YdeE
MPEVKHCSEIKLVGIRVLCGGDEYLEEIPKASRQLSERIDEISNVVDRSLQHGAFVVDNSSEREDGYWVCVEVSDYEDIPANMVTLTIPSQRYAVLRHKGSNYKIREAYCDLHQWIEGNGYKRVTDNWHLEVFHNWSDSQNIDVELMDTIG